MSDGSFHQIECAVSIDGVTSGWERWGSYAYLSRQSAVAALHGCRQRSDGLFEPNEEREDGVSLLYRIVVS